ncbi:MULTISPECIES: hypothetical protein [Metabacillus]|nr:hypothetical protein [Metabacillus litoralis]
MGQRLVEASMKCLETWGIGTETGGSKYDVSRYMGNRDGSW